MKTPNESKTGPGGGDKCRDFDGDKQGDRKKGRGNDEKHAVAKK